MNVLSSSFTRRKFSFLMERYDNIEEIGFGGMGRVYKAFDKFLLKNVAIKVLARNLASDSQLVRFQNEAKLASRLSHQNIVKIFDFGVDSDNDLYMVMDLVHGESLENWIDRGTGSTGDIIKISSQICDALIHAHFNGVIHRDIKPGNIMLETDENGQILAKLVDFGVAKASSPGAQSVSNGRLVVTPLYSSPEQINGKVFDHRTDIYSLGCVMYSMVTGKPPFKGKTAFNTMDMHLNYAVPSIHLKNEQSDQLLKLQLVIEKAMNKSPALRYQTMQDLKNELLSLSSNEDKAIVTEEKVEQVNLPEVEAAVNLFHRYHIILIVIVVTLALFSIFRIAGEAKEAGKLSPMPVDIVTIEPVAEGRFVSYNESGNVTWLGSSIIRDEKFNYLRDKRIDALEIHGAEIRGTGFEQLRGKSIKRLVIQDSKIDENSFCYLQKLDQLLCLEISFTTFSDRGLQKIGYLPNLKTLNISGCEAITNESAANIVKQFPGLRTLNISGTSIDGEALTKLKSLDSLVSVSLGSLKISDQDIKEFLHNSRFTQIELSHNKDLTDVSLNYLSRHKPLNFLKVNRCSKISTGAIDKFRALKPRCTVLLNRKSFKFQEKRLVNLVDNIILENFDLNEILYDENRVR